MCGFIGYIHDQEHDKIQQERMQEMTSVITHRGPDTQGFFEDEHIMLGFRRLSIIDLEGGQQPLSYENERYWIVLNGEIYNYLELRAELCEAGYTFQTSSDTEVVVALYQAKGEQLVHDLRGMFAFLIWDKENKQLFAARDHFGIKPFFYLEESTKLYCASEKKSILLATGNGGVNMEALQHYLTYQYVPEPLTMSKDIKKLPPGHTLTKKIGEPVHIRAFWQPSFQPVVRSLDEEIKRIKDVLQESVQLHMRSDVPVGSFLSGGIDSTSIVALAKEINPQLKTFTVGFDGEGFSEIDVAKETAERLDVENSHYIISPEEFAQELPKIMWHMDDPLADPAAIPLYFVAREASKQVKVVLSGEGADELFGGYTIYREPESLRMFTYLPQGVKQFLKALAGRLPEGMKGKSFIERGCTPIEERYYGNAKIYGELEKRQVLHAYNPAYSYEQITQPLYAQIEDYHDVHKMQYIDMHTWLRGDILVKADKMTMAHSLELRVPFLDKEVFRVASTIDLSLKLANKTTKYALREAMREFVPEHVLYRRKLGFPVPIRHWLKNELHDWAVTLIKESNTEHLVNKKYVLEQLQDHCAGKGDYSRKIWTVLMFMIWHQIFIETEQQEFLAKELQLV